MTLFDHFLILMLFLVQPIHGWLSFQRYLKKIAAGGPVDRPKLYRQTQLLEWGFLAALLAVFFSLSRDLGTLGFVDAGGTGFWICAALLTGGSIAMILSTKSVRQLSQSERDEQRAAFGDLGHFLPQNDEDLASFYRVSVTAGIVEEIVFRGMLLGRLVKRFSKHWAAIISAAAFAATHLLDPNAFLVVPGLFLVGVALAYLAYRSANLSLPIFVHMGVNGLAVLLLAFADEIEDAVDPVEALVRSLL